MSLSDNDIIKALECPASEVDVLCTECPYRTHNGLTCHSALAKDTIDLINRQKAENEALTEKLNGAIAGQETLQKALAKETKRREVQADRLREERSQKYMQTDMLCKMRTDLSKAKAEAIKEFVGKLKAEFKEMYFAYDYAYFCEIFDNLVKEMVGEG